MTVMHIVTHSKKTSQLTCKFTLSKRVMSRQAGLVRAVPRGRPYVTRTTSNQPAILGPTTHQQLETASKQV